MSKKICLIDRFLRKFSRLKHFLPFLKIKVLKSCFDHYTFVITFEKGHITFAYRYLGKSLTEISSSILFIQRKEKIENCPLTQCSRRRSSSWAGQNQGPTGRGSSSSVRGRPSSPASCPAGATALCTGGKSTLRKKK